jgi:hypothetical protein
MKWMPPSRGAVSKSPHTASKTGYLMKIMLLLLLLVISPEGQAANALSPAPDAPSTREQIKLDRAKAKAEDENGPKTRFWDRDADGKRPWDRSKEIPLTKDENGLSRPPLAF